MKTENKQEPDTLQWKHAWGMRRQRHGGQTATANPWSSTTALVYSSPSGAEGLVGSALVATGYSGNL